MKKITLLIGLIALMATSSMAQCPGSVTVNIPDANFKAALIANGVDLNSDGEIQCSEAATFSGTLDVSYSNISDMTGIEAFTSLTQLSCEGNHFASLDLSSNTALQYLECYHCPLTSLNVTGLTLLTYIDCSYNHLAALDVSSNTALQTLYCYNNSLTSLNTSGLNTLTNIDCSGNLLTGLDVSSNTAIQTLYCGSNLLTSLSVSSNTALTSLACDNNSLTNLYVSANPNIHFLQCNNNSLISLDVKNGNNTSLITFFAFNNPALTCIQVDDAAYSTANWTHIDATASFNTYCAASCFVNIPDANFKAALIANGVDINSDGVIQCSEAAAYSNPLDVRHLSISDLTGIEAFTNLTSLNCNFNSISSLDLSSNTALQTLDCTNTSLMSLNVSGLTNLTNINCEDNYLSVLDVSSNTALQSLNCTDNRLTSLDVSSNTALQALNCSYNNLLTSLNVSGLTALTYLDCRYDQLTALDASTTTGLQTLYCFNNLLTSLNVSSLTALTEIDCRNNLLTGLDLSTNTALQTLNCERNLLTSLSVSGITSPTYIDCSRNQLTGLDVSSCAVLQNLYCNYNTLTSLNVSGLTALLCIDCSNNQLTGLDVSSNTALYRFFCYNNSLASLNVKNGNNVNFHDFFATNNSGLTCIQVDDAIFSTTYWTNIDGLESYSTFCPITWTGAAGTDWNDAANWSGNSLPTAAVDVIIPSGPANQPHITSDPATPAECNNLSVQSGASLTIDPGKALTATGSTTVGGTFTIASDITGTGSFIDHGFSGTAIVNKHLDLTSKHTGSARWWYIGSPITTIAASDAFGTLSSSPGNGTRVFYYNEPSLNHGYVAMTDADILVPLQGYAYKNFSGFSVSATYTGILNTGTIGGTANLTRTSGVTKEGFNLVSNPFTSAINWGDPTNGTPSDLVKTNLEPTIQYRASGTYAVYNSLDGGIGVNNGTQYIPAMQAFWVRVSSGFSQGGLQIGQNARLHSSQAFYKTTSNVSNIFRVAIERDSMIDESAITFFPSALGGYEEYDSQKMLTDDNDYPQLYSITTDNVNVAINGQPELVSGIERIVQLGFLTNVAGNLTLTATNLNDFDANTSVYLEDTQLNIMQDLRQSNQYSFTSGIVDDASRFRLHFGGVTTNVSESADSQLSVYSHENAVYVNSPIDTKGTVEVYDMLGKLIMNSSLVKGLNKVQLSLVNGIYIVKVQTRDELITHKVIIGK